MKSAFKATMFTKNSTCFVRKLKCPEIHETRLKCNIRHFPYTNTVMFNKKLLPVSEDVRLYTYNIELINFEMSNEMF